VLRYTYITCLFYHSPDYFTTLFQLVRLYVSLVQSGANLHWHQTANWMKWQRFWFVFGRGSVRISNGTHNTPVEVCRGFPQSLQSNQNIKSKCRFTHSMSCPWHAAKSLDCLSNLIYTARPCLIHTCYAMPMSCSDNAVLLKATAQHGRRETACERPARVRLLPATTRSSTKIVIRSIPFLLTTIHTHDCKEW